MEAKYWPIKSLACVRTSSLERLLLATCWLTTLPKHANSVQAGACNINDCHYNYNYWQTVKVIQLNQFVTTPLHYWRSNGFIICICVFKLIEWYRTKGSAYKVCRVFYVSISLPLKSKFFLTKTQVSYLSLSI